MTNEAHRGKPDAGNPHVRFDEGGVASAKPRRGSLLHRSEGLLLLAVLVAQLSAAGDAEVRLGGWIGRRADSVIAARLVGEKAKGAVFDETERAFETCYDDVHEPPPNGESLGFWQGEYWGKTVLSSVGAARYANDAAFKTFLEQKALRLIRGHQRPNGYLATYTNEDFVVGWNWNIWGRKYTMWALVEVYRLTGNREILRAAGRMADHLIAQIDRLGVSLADTGCFRGLPSMSILKPVVLLYEETKEPRYLAFARSIVAENDRPDGRVPNLIANAFGDRPVHTWYPNPDDWAKAYEMMSLLEGFVEYAKVTGERRPFEAVERIWEKLVCDELNVLGGVGFKDHFVQAAACPQAITEVCDVIHWMRLNRFLYEETGRTKYLDYWERAFMNAFLAGITTDGAWGAHDVRCHGYRHLTIPGEIEMQYHICCVDNIPRAFWDYADLQVRERGDRVEVNFYSDVTVKRPGLTLSIEGDYPHKESVVVKIDANRPRSVSLRVPAWAKGAMKVNGRPADGDRVVLPDVFGKAEIRLQFDLPLRREAVVLRKPVGDLAWYWNEKFEMTSFQPEMKGLSRTKPGTVVWKGPLLQAMRGGVRLDFAETADKDCSAGDYFTIWAEAEVGEK